MEKQSAETPTSTPVKKPRSEAQIQALARGRQTRTDNALLKKKEAENQKTPSPVVKLAPPPPPPVSRPPTPVKKPRAPRVQKAPMQKMISEESKEKEKVDTYEKETPMPEVMPPPIMTQMPVPMMQKQPTRLKRMM